MLKDKFNILLLIYIFSRPLLYLMGYLVLHDELSKELFHIVDTSAILIFIIVFLFISFTSAKSYYIKYFITLFVSYFLVILYFEIRIPYYMDGKVFVYLHFIICFLIQSFFSVVIFYINRKIKGYRKKRTVKRVWDISIHFTVQPLLLINLGWGNVEWYLSLVIQFSGPFNRPEWGMIFIELPMAMYGLWWWVPGLYYIVCVSNHWRHCLMNTKNRFYWVLKI